MTYSPWLKRLINSHPSKRGSPSKLSSIPLILLFTAICKGHDHKKNIFKAIVVLKWRLTHILIKCTFYNILLKNINYKHYSRFIKHYKHDSLRLQSFGSNLAQKEKFQ